MSEALLSVLDTFVQVDLADGRRLFGRLWRPDCAEPVPAIVEIGPYRVFDVSRPLGEALFPWWAARGYGVLVLDTAGSGGSSGLLTDEYLPGEIDDAVAAVGWCAGQDWCDGVVGMSGLSWAAFVALRVAARRPAALKALVLGGVSEDGWATDIHHLGGASYAARVDWAGTMLMFNAMPPDPLQVGDGWRGAWLERLASDRPWIETWLSHPARDAYWAGKAADPADLDTPLLIYAGLADKYATSAVRIARAWRGPVRTILGPWDHTVPCVAGREPRIGFLQEALRWWDRWLKGRDTGVMDDPPLRLWLGLPDRDGLTVEGHWLGCSWPRVEAGGLTFVVDGEGLRLEPQGGPAAGIIVLSPSPRMPEALGADLYEDAPAAYDLARARERGAFVCLSRPFEADAEVAPTPVLTCHLTSEPPGGLFVARLLDVAPDGRAVRMAVGALSLASHRAAGDISLPFQATAWILAAGHRLGVALEADGWPTLWPGPATARLTLRRETLRLRLVQSVGEGPFPAFEPPATAPRARPEPLKWLDTHSHRLLISGLDGAVGRDARMLAHHLPATGTDYFAASRFELALERAGREAAAAKITRFAFRRSDWSVAVDTRLIVRSRPGAFDITWTVRACEDGRRVFDDTRSAAVPRRVV
jgi:uncharacterized protein